MRISSCSDHARRSNVEGGSAWGRSPWLCNAWITSTVGAHSRVRTTTGRTVRARVPAGTVSMPSSCATVSTAVFDLLLRWAPTFGRTKSIANGAGDRGPHQQPERGPEEPWHAPDDVVDGEQQQRQHEEPADVEVARRCRELDAEVDVRERRSARRRAPGRRRARPPPLALCPVNRAGCHHVTTTSADPRPRPRCRAA